MKIRNGFVSNSSSSSFVIVVPNEIHEKVLAEMNDEVASAIINSFANNKFKEDKGMIVFFDYSDDCGSSLWDDFNIPEELEKYDGKKSNYLDTPSDAFYDYYNIIKKYSNEVLILSSDF